jgi:hypothetical protein|tara:strand:- start:927 stop:1109 length:183 start_codon:yes stop_codon:yes gene_type:complete
LILGVTISIVDIMRQKSMSDNVVKFPTTTPVSTVDKQFLELEKQQQQIEEQRRQIEATKK